MKIYHLKIALRGVSPMVRRRLRIPGTTSLAMLHECIQIINHWDDSNLHQFHIYGKDYGINYVGGLCYSDNAHTVYPDDFNFNRVINSIMNIISLNISSMISETIYTGKFTDSR